MAETGAVGGVFTPTVTNLKQQSQIEGVDRNLGKQNANQNTDATRSPNTGNRAVASTPARTEGVRAGTENNLQQQAKNLKIFKDNCYQLQKKLAILNLKRIGIC